MTLVAAAGQADVFVLVPDLNSAPVEGIKAQLDQATAQIDGDLPDLSLHTEGDIHPHPPVDLSQEESLPVGVWASGAQVTARWPKRSAGVCPPNAL
jgi:hypothetical protein